ncbi:MAG: putative metalloprotease CJM1_0395 family protein [Campylobacterota bacterium]|nr:putative metalloprotease CJM1_0395 family protein [Campylobacterota bacterium]
MQINSTSGFTSDFIRINDQKLGRTKNDEKEVFQKSEEEGEDSVKKGSDSVLISKLQATDTKVRAHEAAHLAAGGGVVTGGANFSYTRGPDGKMYAVGGEVPIDSSEASTPEATIQKARQLAAAALAPADPSPTDYRVAASAVVMEMRARMELVREQMERLNGEKTYNGLNDQDSDSRSKAEDVESSQEAIAA